MHRIAAKMLLVALLMSAFAHAQSLGDVARENREKKQAKASSATKPKLITNENLPSNPVASSSETEYNLRAAGGTSPAGGQSAAHQPAEHQSAEQWKSRILAQKNAVANLQAQIDKVSDSIHFVIAGAYYNGVQYNQHQEKKQENVTQMQQQLEEQKKNLAAMQEAAREAGMGSAVYDP
jgi:hypothetical protein